MPPYLILGTDVLLLTGQERGSGVGAGARAHTYNLSIQKTEPRGL